MAAKRKRAALEAFDPNKSDSDDANFDPKEDQPKKSKKRPKSLRSRSAKGGTRRRDRYDGSDIDDDDAGSEDSDSFGESDHEMADESNDEQGHVTAFGRRARKAAVLPKNYKESSDGSDDDGDGGGDDDDKKSADDSDNQSPRKTRFRRPNVAPPPKHPSKIITIKFNPGAIAPAMTGPTRRSTRARTQDAEDLVELSASGHHAQRAKSSRSKSPETLVRGRSSRAAKGLKKVAESIAEATQESTVINTPPHADADSQDDEPAPDPGSAHASPVMADAATAADVDGIVEDSAAEEDAVPVITVSADADLDDDGRVATNGDNNNNQSEGGDEDEEDDDVGPVTRRARGSRSAGRVGQHHDDQDEPAAPVGVPAARRRLTRRSSTKKFAQEQSSDFEPMDSNDEDVSGSDSDKNNDGNDSTPPRRSGRTKSISKGPRSDDSADDAELDQDELAFEAQELRKDSHSRSRRRRRRSTPIKYQDPKPMERRSRKPVNYAIAPLPGITIDDEEPDDPTPSRPARRKGGAAWERSLNTTYGPFGGAGTSVLGGPWGTGAAAGADSDSSDDEMMHRSNAGGVIAGGINIGMTPTAAVHPAILAGTGQTVNMDALGGVGATPNVGKIKNQKALADADPIGVDLNTDFSKVGGLQQHIDQLKEMVQLPLLYPELFLRFHVTPPRGVLFHGPPGTGKTLLARALANSASVNGRKITFYMRKGADALSKWVGEAEKQLRLLFEEARRTQPSIIFFDEIDGLAPVRSSKQEQIHASIVSTLLALMDGMDGRGQVIVIGATNRPDNIDPALRRPGRFDREFYFPLPDVEGRRSIIDIHTAGWGLNDNFKDMLAQRTKGCGGADLRALCTEATLNSIQRTYPQIYASREKLVVDPSNVTVRATDFLLALEKLVPSSERSISSAAAPLPTTTEPLLREELNRITRQLDLVMPRKKKRTALEEAMFEQYHDEDDGFARETLTQEFERSQIFRPRLLIHGIQGMGQHYLGPAILHYLEGVHVQNFDLPILLSDVLSLEHAVISRFNEMKRHRPSVLFVPNIDSWYDHLGSNTFRVFKSLLRGVLSTDQVLLLATANSQWDQLPSEIRVSLFGYSSKNRIEISRPSSSHRREFFAPILQHVQKTPGDFPNPENRKKRVLEVLPVAPVPAPKPPSRGEIKDIEKRDRLLLNVLKIHLQPIMDQITRKYKKFRQPVLPPAQIKYLLAESDPNYVRPDVDAAMPRPFEVARDKHGNESLRETATGKTFYNLDTSTIEERLSNGFYTRPKDFLFDIQTLAKDARNIGDKERTLKANELVTNVEVDVSIVEHNTAVINWESLYQRQLQRTQQREEKERRRLAAQAQAQAHAQAQAEADGQSEGTQTTQVTDRVQSDIAGGNDSDSQGPVTLGEAIPGSRSITTARFQLKNPLPNGGSHSSSQDADRSGTSRDLSGTSGSHDDDVEMGGTFSGETQEASQMRPPSIVTKPAVKPNGQLSQRSAVTSLPPGVSPSQLANDASSTKTSDLSVKSSGNWTPATNGYHGDRSSLTVEDMPDTQRVGHASLMSVRSSGQSVSIISGGSGPGSSPSSGQRTHAAGHSRPSINNILNSSPSSPSLLQASGSSLSPRHAIPVDETSANELLDSITSGTSGLTIDQHEQIYHELMSELWATRGEWNRTRVLDRLKHVFNLTIREIEDNQLVLQPSQ